MKVNWPDVLQDFSFSRFCVYLRLVAIPCKVTDKKCGSQISVGSHWGKFFLNITCKTPWFKTGRHMKHTSEGKMRWMINTVSSRMWWKMGVAAKKGKKNWRGERKKTPDGEKTIKCRKEQCINQYQQVELFSVLASEAARWHDLFSVQTEWVVSSVIDTAKVLVLTHSLTRTQQSSAEMAITWRARRTSSHWRADIVTSTFLTVS